MICEGSALEGDFGCQENAIFLVVGFPGLEEGSCFIDDKCMPSILKQNTGACYTRECWLDFDKA